MKYCNFKRRGIHTRLQVIIDKSGGYNRYKAADYLMEKYNIENRDIAFEMAIKENIEEEIEAIGLEAVIELTEKSLILKEKRFNRLCNSLLKPISNIINRY